MARGNFNDLSRIVLADPERARRVAELKEEALLEIQEFSLDELRRNLGLTQQEMAERLGITQGAVSLGLRFTATLEHVQTYLSSMGYEMEIHAIGHGQDVIVKV